MAKFYEELTEELQAFIRRQLVFFVATAPHEGRINLSPKGLDTFRCLDTKTVGYLDLTGSGNETAAHLAHDGRMCLMFCSFGEKPLILRLYGRGRAVRPRDAEWAELHKKFAPVVGERQIILLHVESLQTSCGFGVPFGELRERPTMREWSEKKAAYIPQYQREKNLSSIDGLPTYLFED